MRDTANISRLSALKPDYMGFIFYDKSPRSVLGHTDPLVLMDIPAEIVKTGVFVNSSAEEIKAMAKLYQLDAIQLHGSESPGLCRDLKSEGLKVLKAFHPKSEEDIKATEEYSGVCDYFLFDTPSKSHGGTGQKFDWRLLKSYKGSVPFFLSGGIEPGDLSILQELTEIKPAGVDINSRFESAPGVKDNEKIKKFIEGLRADK